MRAAIRAEFGRILLAAVATASALFFVAYHAVGQSPARDGPPKLGASAQQSPGKLPSINIKVDLVSTPLVVTDATGEPVLDLTEKNFRVSDNGVNEKIEDFEIGGEPLSVAIVVETSSRIEALLPTIRRTGILFTENVVGLDGDATVIGYDFEVDKLLPFTTDHDAIEKTFASIQEGRSGARLCDALSEAVRTLRDRPAERRRVIVTLGEGRDIGSEAKFGEVLREAQLANVTIYSVGLSTAAAAFRGADQENGVRPIAPPGINTQPPTPGVPQTPDTQQLSNGNLDLTALARWAVRHATSPIREHPLEIAAVGTGGLYQGTVKDKSIETAIDRIGGELHGSYTLSYRPVGTDANTYHEIKVSVDRAGLKVRTRAGYYPGA
jgi:VWFA-related protein